MVDSTNIEKLVKLVRQETKPAIGCTEPVAVAFAAAAAKKYLHEDVGKVDINVSLNIYKNGKSVTIPFTSESGLDLAAALGIISGNPDDGYYIFKNVNKDILDKAKAMLSKNVIKVKIAHDCEEVFVEVNMYGKEHFVHTISSGGHTHIQKVEVDGKVEYSGSDKKTSVLSCSILKDLTFKDLREIIEKTDLNDIRFLLDGVKMNKSAAEQGLKAEKGSGFGSAFLNFSKKCKVSSDPAFKARIYTAAAADFRMGGGNSPIMTSGGSGNQGIGVILPIAVAAHEVNASEEKLIRSLFFGHAVNLYIKSYTGKLSSLCGCSIASGIGASAAITWMLGGNDEQIAGAVQNMLANTTGVICDGAKESCALKLSTSAEEAVISAYLACSDVIVPKSKGIISSSVEDTIKNLGILCKKGLSNTDEVIVDDIISKN